jgi:hypothetical protein
MTKLLHGKVHGRTIELTEDAGLADGMEVEVRLRVTQTAQPWGEGLRRCAGALADDPEWDVIMDEIHQARKQERRALPEEA